MQRLQLKSGHRPLQSTRFALLTAILFASCTKYGTPKQKLTIKSALADDVFLYRIPDPQQPDPDTFVAIRRIATNKGFEIPRGYYYVSTECSGYAFEHKGKKSLTIRMSTVELVKNGGSAESTAEEPVPLECTDPVDGHPSRWTDRTAFPVFPGETSFTLTKKPFTVTSPATGPITHKIPVAPVLLTGGTTESPDRYFILSEEQEVSNTSYVVSAQAGRRIWVPPGEFTIEINGSRRKIRVENNVQNEVLAGTFRIAMPPAFSPEARAEAGGQPVFAYIDEGVLFNLNTDYLVLPGEYTLSIEGTEIQRTILIEPHKKTEIPTRVAQVDSPPCPVGATCRPPSKITIHKEQRPFALAFVTPGVPFLVFDEAYEFGVDGTRGIYRTLHTGTTTLPKSTLARARLQWEVRPATGRQRTDLVRLETRGEGNFGRSLDLLFSKPDEVYIPAGPYQVTYFVGDPSAERSKTRNDINFSEGSTRTVVIPLYVERSQKSRDPIAGEQTPSEKEKSGTLPSSLSPIRH
jgi:hypothetical protein